MASVAGSTVAVTIVRLVALGVLARFLTREDFGTVAAAMLVSALAQIFFLRGVAPALIQRSVLHKRHEHSASAVGLTGGLVFAGLLWVIAPFAAAQLNAIDATPVIRTFASLFVVNAATVVPNALHRRNLQFGRLAIAEVAGTFVGYALVSITMALWGFGLWSLVGGNIAQAIITLAMLWRTHPPEIPRQASWAGFRELYKTSAGFSLGALGLFLSNRADAIGVSRVLGTDALGVYNNAYRLMAEPSDRLGQVFGRVLLPAMSKIQNDKGRLRHAYLDGAATVALVTLPVGVLGALLADELILVLLGSNWSDAVSPFAVLALTMTLRTSFRLSEALVGATGAVFRRAWRQWAFAGLVIAGVAIGSRWNLTGVAVGVSLAMVVNWCLMASLALREVEASWALMARAHLPAFRTMIPTVLLGYGTMTFVRSLTDEGLVVLLSAGFVAAVTMAGLVIGAPGRFSTGGVRRLTAAIR